MSDPIKHLYNLAARAERPARFMRNKLYVGIKTRSKSNGEYSKQLSIWTFWGRPYNRFEYDAIYGSDILSIAKDAISAEASANNRDVIETNGAIYQAPRWIHRPKVETP